MHDLLTQRGLRDRSEIALVMPLPVPIPPSPDASAALLDAFAERGITFHGAQQVTGLDPERKVVMLADGTELPYDLFLGIPVHHVPEVVAESGMCVDGWIPVNPLTLETSSPGVYAVGDVTSVGTPKAGSMSEGQAAVVAEEIIALHREGPEPDSYDGYGICYIELGGDEVARVQITFLSGETPRGEYDGASADHLAEKAEFGSSRIRRWFGQEWSSY